MKMLYNQFLCALLLCLFSVSCSSRSPQSVSPVEVDTDTLKNAFISQKVDLYPCYQSSFLAPRPEGLVNMNVLINQKGNVATGSIESSDFTDSKFHNCLIDKVQAWSFPNVGPGLNVQLVYPFVFKDRG